MSDEWVVIPPAALSTEALAGLIEQYVLREGTEYGQRDYTLDEKVRHVRRQLEAGRVLIVYWSEHNEAEIVTARDLQDKPRFMPNPGRAVRGD